MKNFDSRTYSINDFLEWDKNNQLRLSPKFQRRSVWTDNARSYLIDTIIRGLPIPKIFIRQQLDAKTRLSIREVVDGQQRLRTIISFLSDGFKINKKHNIEYGGLYFSQLSEVDDSIQATILNYEISVDLLVNMPDADVLDVFSRLNSYAVILNEQEKINSNHFGPFKIIADKIAHMYNKFWLDNRILREQDIFRMADVTLTADILIAMCEGIKSKKQIKSYYDQYETEFPYDPQVIEHEFDNIMSKTKLIFNEGLINSEFRRIHLFYTLFTAIYHIEYGLKNIDPKIKLNITKSNAVRIHDALQKVNLLFNKGDDVPLTKEQEKFIEDSRRATTDAQVRIRRTKYVTNIIQEADGN